MNINPKSAVQDHFEDILLDKIREALQRGTDQHGSEWLSHIHTEMNTLDNVKHVWDIHVQARVLEAFVALDYGRYEEFLEKIASAIGYMSNMSLKAMFLLDREHDIKMKLEREMGF